MATSRSSKPLQYGGFVRGCDVACLRRAFGGQVKGHKGKGLLEISRFSHHQYILSTDPGRLRPQAQKLRRPQLPAQEPTPQVISKGLPSRNT